MSQSSLFEASHRRPLADRLRPQTIEEFAGQAHLLAEGMPLRDAIVHGEVGNVIFWGPPGSGKTTLAHIIAGRSAAHFEPFSAVTEGVPRVREIIKDAEARLVREGRQTILFCDEIHRFNKAQQDAFLPWVEKGTITLIGATTENPSFALTGALLSRCQVHVLEQLAAGALEEICRRGAAVVSVELDTEALSSLVRFADGDARRALNALEALAEHRAVTDGDPGSVTQAELEGVLSRRLPRYDRGGEEHYNLISALHKAIRGSDPDAALYWLARMVIGGEDARYLARRLIRMAAEDVGLADPRALSVALAAKDAFHVLGSPEGELALAEAAVYLATAPKSNRVYRAWDDAMRAARDHPAAPVPLHIRNAPTGLMKELGYGAGYRNDHAEQEALAVGQGYLPDALGDVQWYVPRNVGYEKAVSERLEWWARLKAQATETG